MAYEAKVLKVMIASPGDVSKERQIARDVIHEWNTVHAEDRRMVLAPVGWETDAYPEMGDRPQEIINKQVLRDCDLLIAVFWTRLGTPTGAATSGTVEEIEEHLARGKQALIYFSQVPVRPDSVDEEQFSALKGFRQSCEQRGLVQGYENLTEFREKLTRQLTQVVISAFGQGSSREIAEGQSGTAAYPSLSEDAKVLLLEAASDDNGAILLYVSIAGTHLQANTIEFIERHNRRSEERWRAALEELANAGLIEDRTGKGEVFNVTNRGFDTADFYGAG